MFVDSLFFQFLMKLNDLLKIDLTAAEWLNYSVGTIASAISGYFAIKLVMDFVKKGKFEYFGYYCIIVSTVCYFSL